VRGYSPQFWIILFFYKTGSDVLGMQSLKTILELAKENAQLITFRIKVHFWVLDFSEGKGTNKGRRPAPNYW
jgi:hypothetical protein